LNLLRTILKITAFASMVFLWMEITSSAQSVTNSDTSNAAAGQTTNQNAVDIENGKNEFGFWAGGSFHSSTKIGTTPDAKFGIFALRYTRVLSSGDSAVLKYAVDVVPAAVLSFPDSFFAGQRDSVYSAGLTPIGFQVSFRPKKKVQPFAGAGGGFLYFVDPIPDFRGAQFNFTFDFDGGVQIMTKNHKAVTLGYKFYHVSNGFRGQINPGFDNNVFYAGFSIFK